MVIYSLGEISAMAGGKLDGNMDYQVSEILIDSRLYSDYRRTLFFALTGKNHDGHDYIAELFEQGVRCFVVEKIPDNAKRLENCNFVIVENTLRALQITVAAHREKFDDNLVVAITGSNGKTSVKEWFAQFLELSGNSVIKSPKSYNSQVGVPLSVWQINDNTTWAIFEAGISKPGEMQNLAEIIKPMCGILTNIGEAHQENFESYEAKLKEKLLLFKSCYTVLYGANSELIRQNVVAFSAKHDIRLYSWSYGAEITDTLNITKVEPAKNGTNISAIYVDDKKQFQVSVFFPFVDTASIENLILIWLFFLTFNASAETYDFFAKLKPIEMRLQLQEGINNCTIINDSYNSDLSSLRIALDFMNSQKQTNQKTVILSDIFQSGLSKNDLYSEVSNLLKKHNITRIIGIGHDLMACSAFFENAAFYPDTQTFVSNLFKHEFANETILIKGARKFQLERISHFLQRRVHQTVLEINLSAMVDNLNYFRALLKPETKIMAMVKAFSYGSGSHEIANELMHQRVDYLGVAYVDEGIEIRKAGVDLPILVINPDKREFETMLEHKLEPEIYDIEDLQLLETTAQYLKIEKVNAHIKIDTGMNRLGFKELNISLLLQFFRQPRTVHIKSIFSHLAASDSDFHNEFTEQQISLFLKVYDKITTVIGYKPMRHILNSAGIERFTAAQFDMVRLGIGLYGIGSEFPSKLKPISQLKTVVAQVKNVSAGESVSYNRTKYVHETRQIAVISIGYADGLNRRYGFGKGQVFVRGKLVPIIGAICMDMCMIDVTNTSVQAGDEVTIFGENPTISLMAKMLDTIPYEIMTSISGRVKKVYYKE